MSAGVEPANVANSEILGEWVKSNPERVPRHVWHSPEPDDIGGLWFVVTLPGFPGWQFGAYFDRFNSFAGFRMSPFNEGHRLATVPTPNGGITTRALRKVPLGAVERQARQYMRELALGNLDDAKAQLTITDTDVTIVQPLYRGGGAGSAWAIAAQAAVDAAAIEIVRTGQRGTDDLVYAKAAALYVTLLTKPKPIERMAETMICSISQARNLVAKARDRDLLTRVGQGRVGGELTAKAIDLLKGNQ